MSVAPWECCFCECRSNSGKSAYGFEKNGAVAHAICEDCIDIASGALASRRSDKKRRDANKSNGKKSNTDWWTEERLAALQNGYAAGQPVAEIAKKIGATRRAVIGKANRLGLRHPRASWVANHRPDAVWAEAVA